MGRASPPKTLITEYRRIAERFVKAKLFGPKLYVERVKKWLVVVLLLPSLAGISLTQFGNVEGELNNAEVSGGTLGLKFSFNTSELQGLAVVIASTIVFCVLIFINYRYGVMLAKDERDSAEMELELRRKESMERLLIEFWKSRSHKNDKKARSVGILIVKSNPDFAVDHPDVAIALIELGVDTNLLMSSTND